MSDPIKIVEETRLLLLPKIKSSIELNESCKLYLADCVDLMDKMIKEGTKVDLTVTSPPYDNLRSYENASTWNFDVFKKIADRLYEVTSDGGVVVWVVGDATINGSETGTSFKQALYFMEKGFKLHDTMIYEKNSSSFPARRDGNRYTQIFEYMFVFFKGKKIRCANLLCDKENKWKGWTNWGKNTEYKADGSLVETKDIKPVPDFSPRNNIWKYTTGFNKCKGIHPAVFPYKLAEDHVKTWSREGDTVFDPFLGSGTTGIAAVRNNRKFIGSEIAENYFEDAVMCIQDEVEKK